jgi:HPt (histidine-containing phosphotransfer) domain-containing protein
MEDLNNIAVINEESVTNLKAIMEDSFPTVIQYFLEDTQGYINNIGAAIDDSNLEEISKHAHTIKSSSLQVGADKVSKLSANIEIIAKTETDKQAAIATIKPIFQALEENFIEATDKYKDLL